MRVSFEHFDDFLKAKIFNIENKVAPNLLETMRKDILKYEPYDTGRLSRSKRIKQEDKEIHIDYKAPYAKYVYNMSSNYKFKTSTHANATSHWDKAAERDNKAKWEKMIKNAIEKELNKNG